MVQKRKVNKKSFSVEIEPAPIIAFAAGMAVGATGMALLKSEDPEVIASPLLLLQKEGN